MSHSSSLPEHSPDESGYFTSLPRRNQPVREESDPSEHNYEEDTADSSARSPVPAPPVAAHGMRFRIFARKSVPLPVRVSFSAPTGEVGESSRRQPRSVTPPPAIGVPVPQSRGMTALERVWVSGMADEVELHRYRLDHYRHSLDDLLASINSQGESADNIMKVTYDVRRVIRRLHMYLAMVIGILVVMVGLLIWMMMH